ncbi:hypothetical protein V5O48_019100 [Marasmius crinis-equi]|uniref:Uncharacterized protein n=1 Tax=Marasmius crinis-equi TaxID=585013 RepID=A0ABR3EJB8_9AGAR
MDDLPETAALKLTYLRHYLKALPSSLNRPQRGELPKFPFETFRIDRNEVQDKGTVGAVNEGFKRIFGWETRMTGNGILKITERGPSINAVADLLEGYIKENPNTDGQPDGVLMKWVEDITEGCIQAIKDAGLEPPDLPAQSRKQKRAEEVEEEAQDVDEVKAFTPDELFERRKKAYPSKYKDLILAER